MFGTVQTEHAARIANYILAHRLERITARDIVRAYRTLRPPEERDTLNSTMDAPVPVRLAARRFRHATKAPRRSHGSSTLPCMSCSPSGPKPSGSAAPQCGRPSTARSAHKPTGDDC